MGAPQVVQIGRSEGDDVATYKAPDPKVPFNFRTRSSVKKKAEALVRAWKERARLDGDEPKEIDLTYVAERCLETGLDAAWAELGGLPETEEHWSQLFAMLKKTASKK